MLHFISVTSQANSQKICQPVPCPVGGTSTVCAFDVNNRTYKMFPSKCAMDEFAKCFNNGKPILFEIQKMFHTYNITD